MLAQTHDSSTCRRWSQEDWGELKSSLRYRLRLQLNTNKQTTKLTGVGNLSSLCSSVCDSTVLCCMGPSTSCGSRLECQVSLWTLDSCCCSLLLLLLEVLREAEWAQRSPRDPALGCTGCRRPYPCEHCTILLVVFGQFQPGDDVHGLQLLEEQLAGIWDSEGGHVAWRLAVVAPETQVNMDQRGGNKGLHLVPLRSSPIAVRHRLMAQKTKEHRWMRNQEWCKVLLFKSCK